VAATNEVVARLMVDHRREETMDGGVSLDRGHIGSQQGGHSGTQQSDQHQPINCSMYCRNH
jgi:hypothetical protein